MDDTQPFIDAITADPADDAPRLVFADWLEERGECARAEFIRVQCELTKLGDCRCIPPCRSRMDYICRSDALRGRAHELLGDYAHIWFRLEGIHEPAGDALFAQWWGDIRRGFRWHVRCTLAEWCGGPCVRCDGSGEAIGSDRPGQWSPDPNYMKCPTCLGSKATKGHAGEICLRHPIESVTLTCRRPHMPMPEIRPQYATWSAGKTDGANTAFTHILPEELYLHLESWVSRSSVWVAYHTEADALAALDRAAVKLGRERAAKLRIDRQNKYESA